MLIACTKIFYDPLLPFPKQMKASCRSLNSPSPSIGRVNKMDVYWFLVGSPMILYFYRLKNSKKSFYEKPVLPSLFDSENMSVVGFFLWCKLNRCRLFYEECKIIFLYFHFTQQFDLGPSCISFMAVFQQDRYQQFDESIKTIVLLF